MLGDWAQRAWCITVGPGDELVDKRGGRRARPGDQANGRPLLIPLVRGGEAVGREPVTAARSRHQQAVTELPAYARQLSRGYPAIPTVFEPDRD